MNKTILKNQKIYFVSNHIFKAILDFLKLSYSFVKKIIFDEI